MTWSNRIRQTHRWLSMALTVGIVVNVIAYAQGEPPAWVGALAAIPLTFLYFSGLYMLVQPYAAKWRGARRAA